MPAKASRKPARAARKPAKSSSPTKGLGALPEWNLADLYPAMDAPELKRDLARADADSVAFEADYKGKLAALTAGRKACRSGEALRGAGGSARPADFLCGPRLCGQQHRSGARQVLRRHPGEDHRGLAASSVLHARAQSPRRRGARSRDARSRARPLPAVDRGRAQGEAVSARGPRRGTVPREVGDRRGRAEPAVHRDDRGAALQGRRQGARARGDAHLDAGQGRQEASGRLRGAGENLQGKPAHLHARHQHACQGQGDFRPLARLQGHRRRAASVEPRRAGSGRGAGIGGARRLSAPVASLLRAESASGSARSACRIGTATRRCRRSTRARSAGARRRTRCCPPTARFRRAWPTSPAISSRATGSTRRRGPASSPARSRIRPCRRRIPMCCSTIRASRAT